MELADIGKGPDKIVKEGIFIRFPELVPRSEFGENFWNSQYHRRLLLVGESNYMMPGDTESVFCDPEKWYRGKNVTLIPNDETIKRNFDNWKEGYSGFDKVFNIVKQVLNDTGYTATAALNESAFYNYYLRPALKWKKGLSMSLCLNKLDSEVAGGALIGLIEFYQIDVVVFLSAYAYKDFMRYCKSHNITNLPIVDFVYHPTGRFTVTKWHNNNPNCGPKLHRILREHWLKSR